MQYALTTSFPSHTRALQTRANHVHALRTSVTRQPLIIVHRPRDITTLANGIYHHHVISRQQQQLGPSARQPARHQSSSSSSTQRPSTGRNNANDLDRDFILSILQAQPSARDSRSYLKAFASDQHRPARQQQQRQPNAHSSKQDLLDAAARALQGRQGDAPRVAEDDEGVGNDDIEANTASPSEFAKRLAEAAAKSGQDEEEVAAEKSTELVQSLLEPITRHTAVVKVQGPFTPRQVSSIAEGLIYLQRLGLVSIVVVDDEAWSDSGHIGASSSQLRKEMVQTTHALAEALESMGGKALPLIKNIFRLAQHPPEVNPAASTVDDPALAAFHSPTTQVESLHALKSALQRGEMPIIPPIAFDADLAAVAVYANDAVKTLVSALAQEGQSDRLMADGGRSGIDLTPLRMMIINREGGIPSPARGGNPHLSINLESEFDYIRDTFIWHKTHATSLQNLSLVRSCLQQLPRESSAVIVSHRSPKALIANLITNRPAHSPSLHHSLLPAKQIQHTPTIVRLGLPIRVIRDLKQVDKEKLTRLLEASFGKTLGADQYYARLERDMDFVIVCGEGERDYQAAAIVTLERDPENPGSAPISYLDKFAVLPSLQGDGTVDFLWTALRDETFGLGLLDALNPNGGKEGVGFGTDLVWRSRADNPVNKWYFERSNGFVHIPEMGQGGTKGTMFWSDAEDRLLRQLDSSSDSSGHERKSISIVTEEEEGRLARWARVIGSIKSCWV